MGGRIEELVVECELFTDKPAVSNAAHVAVSFYTNNKERVDCTRFREEGYFIGSEMNGILPFAVF